MKVNYFAIGLTSVVVASCGVVIAYYSYKYGWLNRDAATAFKYMKIKLITTVEECDDIIAQLRKNCSTHRAVGFDCEWVSIKGTRKPIALLQLSSYNGLSGLFRLNKIQIPKSLQDFLEDETIYKLGVAPDHDANCLHQDYGALVKSTLDLRHIAQIAGYRPEGLAGLTKTHLKAVLDKHWRIRCSDWEAEPLTKRQLVYAAADAHAAIRIFVKLIESINGNRWFRKNKNDVWADLDGLCGKYLNVGVKLKTVNKHGGTGKSSKPYVNLVRTKPLYHNCYLQAPDGELLCTCDNKKARWYVEKGLADVVAESPLSVRLRFEPAGRSVGLCGQYYQLVKDNKCVVCGVTNSYIRKNVVPREYRKYFPDVMKDHSSHDVLLLCSPCHQRSNCSDQLVRQQLDLECSAPIAVTDKFCEDSESKKIRSAARALLHQTKKHTIPEARKNELVSIMQEYFGQEDITTEMLETAANVQVVFENVDYESHGFKVVEYYVENKDLLQLELLWRKHFVDEMKPRFLPTLWSFKHNEDRLRVRLAENRLSVEEMKSIGLKWFQ